MGKPLPMRLTQVNPARRAKIKARITELARQAEAAGELPDPRAIRRKLREERLINMTVNAVHMHLYSMGIPHRGCQTVLNPAVSTREAPVTTNDVDIDTAAQIEYLKKELRDTRENYKKALQRVGGQDALMRTIRKEIVALPPSPVHFDLRSHEGRDHTQDAVCQLACMHLGEIVSPEKTFGLGDYDLSMAQARVQTYVDSVLDLAVNHHSGETFKRLWVIGLGDSLNGTIHAELERSQEFGVARQTVEAGRLYALMLRDFAAYFPEVVFVGYPGNHGRMHKKPSYIDKTDNYDNIAYALTKALVRDIPNVEVRIPESFFTIEEINGHRFLFTHGDMMRAWAGIPWYGKDRARANLADLVKRLDLDFEYFCTSHFHTNMMVEETYGETFFTGSSKGPCGFSIGTKGVGNDPAWLFYGVHKRRGVTFRYPVNMKEADRAVQTRYQA